MNQLIKIKQRRFNKKGISPLLLSVSLIIFFVILSIIIFNSNYETHSIYKQFSKENIITKDNLEVKEIKIKDNALTFTIENNNNEYVTSTLINIDGSKSDQTLQLDGIMPYQEKEITTTYNKGLGEIQEITVSAESLESPLIHSTSSETILNIPITQPEGTSTEKGAAERGIGDELVLLDLYDNQDTIIPINPTTEVTFTAKWIKDPGLPGTNVKILISLSPNFESCTYSDTSNCLAASGSIPIGNNIGQIITTLSNLGTFSWYGKLCTDQNDCDLIINNTDNFTPTGSGQNFLGKPGDYNFNNTWTDFIGFPNRYIDQDPLVEEGLDIDWYSYELENENNPLNLNYLSYQDVGLKDLNLGYVYYTKKTKGTVHSAIKSFINITKPKNALNEFCYEFIGYGYDKEASNPLKLKAYVYNWGEFGNPGFWEQFAGPIEQSSESQLMFCVNITTNPQFREYNINNGRLIALLYDYEGSYRATSPPYWKINSTIYANYIHANYTYSYQPSDELNILPPDECNPPTTGDWIINGEDILCQNKQITLKGNLILRNGAKLELDKVTLKMDVSYDGEFAIVAEIYGGSTLLISQSNITNNKNNNENANYGLLFERSNSLLVLNKSNVEYAGYSSTDTAFRIYSPSLIKESNITQLTSPTTLNLGNGIHNISESSIKCIRNSECTSILVSSQWSVVNITNNTLISIKEGISVNGGNINITNNTIMARRPISLYTSYNQIKNNLLNSSDEFGYTYLNGGEKNILKSNEFTGLATKTLQIGSSDKTYVVDSIVPHTTSFTSSYTSNKITYFINSSYNQLEFASSPSGKLARQWYLDVTVKDVSNQPVQGATVYIRNNLNQLVYTSQTNSSGQIKTQNITQYEIDYSLTPNYLTPYSVTAELGEQSNTVETNLEDNTHLVITLGNILPDVQNIEIKQSPSTNFQDCSEEGCIITPNPGSYATGINIKVTIYDEDENFFQNNPEARIYLCLEPYSQFQPNCNAQNADYFWQLENMMKVPGSDGIYELSKILNENDNTPEFYIPPGDYSMHVDVTENGQQSATDPEKDDKWIYNTLIDTFYVDESNNQVASILLGSTTNYNNIWNSGSRKYKLINQGNVKLNINWESTDFTCSTPALCDSSIWHLTGTDFQIDDDSSHENENSGELPPVFIDSIERLFVYLTGLDVCSEMTCNNINLKETLDTYWHIKPPQSLPVGTYQSTINFILSEYT